MLEFLFNKVAGYLAQILIPKIHLISICVSILKQLLIQGF